jgi:branched-chain amino acid transport system substrate-binding protein
MELRLIYKLEETTMRRTISFLAAFVLATSLSTAWAQTKMKIGFIAARSGALNLVGAEQQRGFELALETLGNKVGGLPVEVVTADSRTNASATVQELSRLIEKERVDVLTGLSASNELLAAAKPITDAKVFLLGTNGGPAQLAGEGCTPYYFNVNFQSTQLTDGIGGYMTGQGIKKLYIMAMDYEGGHEMAAAARKGYKGEVVAQVFTPMAQVDFAADLAKIRASGADGVFVFYPGGASIALVRQWAQAGLQGKIPLFSNVGLSDPLMFPAQGKAALGHIITSVYQSSLDNPENKKFVELFRAKYNRDPSLYAAMQYDAIMLLDAATKEVKGNINDKEALRQALKRANFKSVRGPFKFNTNQMPIQHTYVASVDQRQDGSLYLKTLGIVNENGHDDFASKCPLR